MEIVNHEAEVLYNEEGLAFTETNCVDAACETVLCSTVISKHTNGPDNMGMYVQKIFMSHSCVL